MRCKLKNPKKQKKNGYDRSVYRSLAMITQFGINILVPIVLCGGAGMYLDKLLGTSFLSVILFFVGALAGFRNIYIFAMRTAGDDSGRKKRRADVKAHRIDRMPQDDDPSGDR